MSFYHYAKVMMLKACMLLVRQLMINSTKLQAILIYLWNSTQKRKLELSISLENDKQIVAFRNRLVHAYDSLDNSIVWAIINRHLRPLKSEIEILIQK